MGAELGVSIIEVVKGVSLIIRRSLRDLLCQIPCLEVDFRHEYFDSSGGPLCSSVFSFELVFTVAV